MSLVLVDTSVFVEAERRNLQALERLMTLLDEGVVTYDADLARLLGASAELLRAS